MGVRRRVIAALTGMLLAAIVPLALRGFTVDDALISCRYAHHLATGAGYRFNVGEPSTDGVTPLPWPWILAVFSRSSTLASLTAAKTIGLVAWLFAMSRLSIYVDALARRKVDWPQLAVIVAAATPALGAWAVSGMETGLATALATLSVVSVGSLRARAFGAALAGIACTLRPELVPWAFVTALGHARCSFIESTAAPLDSSSLARRLVGFGSLATLPFAGISLLRLAAFGSAAPLAVLAKPSDLHHGWVYVAAGVILTGPFAAVLAPVAWRRMPAWPRWLLGAALAHLGAVAVAGGDWMPLSRLLVPILPSLAIVFAHTAVVATAWSTLLRWTLCAAGQVFVFWRVGPQAAGVMRQRSALIEQLRDHLRPADRVAALDVGWVGASFDGTVIDLAGVTDPWVAALPGGHTTKAIPSRLLADRGATVLVLQLDEGMTAERSWRDGEFARGVERRVASQPWTRAHFELAGELRGSERLRYALLVRTTEPR